jgi:cold shock CspA family protein
MSFKDKHIPCKDCGGEFVFTAGEQEFYAQKGFTNEPTRCPAGRRARKEGRSLTDITGGRVCPHDVSGNGSNTDEAIESSGASRPRRSDDWSRSSDRPRGESRGWSGERSRGDREPYTGPLPSGPVNATIVRIDPAGRFLFARVDHPQFDVYVHGSLFSQVRRSLQEGDQISVTVEASDRGPRARTFDLR